MLGSPAGPGIIDGDLIIQMVNDTKLEHQPAEAIPYLERMVSENGWPYSVQEFLEHLIKVHRSAVPPPQLINLEIAAVLTENPAVEIREKPDRIPVPKSYSRNRRRK